MSAFIAEREAATRGLLPNVRRTMAALCYALAVPFLAIGAIGICLIWLGEIADEPEPAQKPFHFT